MARYRARLLVLTLLVAACGDDFVEGTGGATDSDGSTNATSGGPTSGTMTGIDMMTMDADSNTESDTTTGTGSSDSLTTTTGDPDTTTTGDPDTPTGETDTDTGGPTCDSNDDCDDTLACNGEETCVANTCQPGTPVACDDGVDCTADACDEEAGGVCVSVAQDSNCSNGVFCDGAEVCDALQGCQPGTAVTCDDMQACTVDACDEDLDACGFTPDDDFCSDGVACNGAEVCSAG